MYIYIYARSEQTQYMYSYVPSEQTQTMLLPGVAKPTYISTMFYIWNTLYTGI